MKTKKDFLTSYNETKKIFLKEMNVDPECDSYVEWQGISTDTERQIFYHLFSAKCSNPLDIVSNTNFIKYCNFRTGIPQCEDFRHERNGHVYFFAPSLLSLLDKGNIVMDGTWSVVKHLPYVQLYIMEHYGKLPEPSLSEVQEVQSASFLSFREIFNY